MQEQITTDKIDRIAGGGSAGFYIQDRRIEGIHNLFRLFNFLIFIINMRAA